MRIYKGDGYLIRVAGSCMLLSFFSFIPSVLSVFSSLSETTTEAKLSFTLVLIFGFMFLFSSWLILFYCLGRVREASGRLINILRQKTVNDELTHLARILQGAFDRERVVLEMLKKDPDDEDLQRDVEQERSNSAQQKKEFWRVVGYAKDWGFEVREKIAGYLPIEEEHPTPFEVPEVHEESV